MEYSQPTFRVSFAGDNLDCPTSSYLTVNVDKLYIAVIGDPTSHNWQSSKYKERDRTFPSARIETTHVVVGANCPCIGPGDTFSIEGRLVVLRTDEHGIEQQLELAGVTVKLWHGPPMVYDNTPLTYTYTGKSTMTDDKGHFEFTGLSEPGCGEKSCHSNYVIQYLGDNLRYCTGTYGGNRAGLGTNGGFLVYDKDHCEPTHD